MTQQFTASEVVKKLRERFASGNDVPVPDVRLTRTEFDVVADLLEAQERAVPVVTRESAINAIEHVGRYNGPGHETEARQMLVEGSPSIANRAPSDAKRLAEALRNLVSEWVAIADDGDATLEDSTIGYRACANRLSAMLAAHHAQAQPPAASVTDAMVERGLKACIQDSDVRLPRYKVVRSIIEAALAAQENPNG